MELTNRTILITGGASGIGFALAKQLVAHGNKVIVCGRSRDNLNKVKEHLPALETIRCDINNPNDLNELVSLLAGRYPQLDTLINNAGVQNQLNLTGGQTTDHAVTHEIRTNLISHISITNRLYTLISSNRNPAIIFVGSALAIVPKYSVPIYSAAKAGLHNYVQSLRHQAKKDNVQIIEVFPDVVDTPMTHHRQNESKMDSGLFAVQVLTQLEKGNIEIFTGRTLFLSVLHRLAPAHALKIINRSLDG
ncbi:MAG: SDR family NAD(P)-dependent oxidoreductase [Gammaproteobacteria bacterium]|nr:SDR family NAD(P)-dependent oxidoreductase [Gammaproteobacteria bacterium]